MARFEIGLGYEGPTDSCMSLTLTLSSGLSQTKEYLIESDAWRRLGKYWNVQTQTGWIVTPDMEEAYADLSDIWKNSFEDERIPGTVKL